MDPPSLDFQCPAQKVQKFKIDDDNAISVDDPIMYGPMEGAESRLLTKILRTPNRAA